MPEGNHDVGMVLLLLKYLKRVEGRTRFQKLVYLLKEKYGIDFSYRFMPYYYGPYSDDLQSDVRMLSLLDLIKVETTSLGRGVLQYDHSLSPQGTKVAKEIQRSIPSAKRKELLSAARALSTLNTNQLVVNAKKLMKQKLGERVIKDLLSI